MKSASPMSTLSSLQVEFESIKESLLIFGPRTSAELLAHRTWQPSPLLSCVARREVGKRLANRRGSEQQSCGPCAQKLSGEVEEEPSEIRTVGRRKVDSGLGCSDRYIKKYDLLGERSGGKAGGARRDLVVRPPQISLANIYEKCQGEAGGRRSPLTSSTWLSTPKLGPDVTGARATVVVDVTDRVNVRASGEKCLAHGSRGAGKGKKHVLRGARFSSFSFL